MYLRTILSLFALGLLATGLSAQTTTFAQFMQAQQFQKLLVFDNNEQSGSSAAATFQTANSPSGIAVDFEFNSDLGFSGALAALNGPQNANFIMQSSTGSAAAGSAPFFNQPIDVGSLEFRRTTPVDGKDLLLKVTFSGAVLVTFNASGAELASENGSTITYSSDFLTFGSPTSNNWAIALSGINPPSTLDTNGLLKDFTAAGTGTFDTATTMIPSIIAIPEPKLYSAIAALLGLAAVSFRRQTRSALHAS
ncbi:MAG TPA: hypothetical protein VK717_08275 [Opitutaceae bacterium]|jgi:hypothetical protein|nr:hypothetical protein [Opitutaceae bacterium]